MAFLSQDSAESGSILMANVGKRALIIVDKMLESIGKRSVIGRNDRRGSQTWMLREQRFAVINEFTVAAKADFLAQPHDSRRGNIGFLRQLPHRDFAYQR